MNPDSVSAQVPDIADGVSLLVNYTSALDKHFPPGFKFGAATASYQIEGGWNASDKGEGIWDRAVHTAPAEIAGGANGDVACDSYHNWRRDVEMVHEMGLNFYRFSISWPRLLPNAFPTKISKSGEKYYNDLINYLLQKGIEPIVTIYHWDLPQKLQDLGGWTNPLISDWFADYARVVFSLFGDRVKTWITINEPINMCDVTYNMKNFAPLIVEPEMAGLLCCKHVLIAHAKAWRMYDKEFSPRGKITIGNHLMWIEAKTKDDEEIAELALQASAGLYSHPIYSKEGGWPLSVEKAMEEYSKKAGYARSKLPAFTKEEILLVRGTYDFYGINYYTSRIARRAKPGEKIGFWFFYGYPEFKIVLETDPTWPVGRQPLIPVLLSIKEDGANITGYTYWTLMDNFEWLSGYDKVKFGLYEVDFNDPKRSRWPRASAFYYSDIIKNHSLDVPFPREFNIKRHKTRNSSTNKIFTFNHLVCILINVSLSFGPVMQ